MGNFEKLSVLVIVVIIVMILVVALHTWSEKPGEDEGGKPALDNVVANEFEDDGGWTAPVPLREDDPLPSADPISDPTDPRPDDKREDLLDIKIDNDMPGPGEGTPSDAPATGPRFYEIQPRDTLSEIAQNECGSIKYVSEIMALNPGVDPSALRVGTKLRLPAVASASSSTRDAPAGGRPAEGPRPGGKAKPGGTYTARAGDTFERISKRVYGTIERWPDIWVANLEKVPDADRIPAGTEIKLP